MEIKEEQILERIKKALIDPDMDYAFQRIDNALKIIEERNDLASLETKESQLNRILDEKYKNYHKDYLDLNKTHIVRFNNKEYSGTKMIIISNEKFDPNKKEYIIKEIFSNDKNESLFISVEKSIYNSNNKGEEKHE